MILLEKFSPCQDCETNDGIFRGTSRRKLKARHFAKKRDPGAAGETNRQHLKIIHHSSLYAMKRATF
jgi:hypothetical protein